MESFAQDLRHASRSLLRQPAFALAAIVTLGLGIGAATAVFSVVHAVLLKPLPFDRDGRVVAITTLWHETGRRSLTVSAPDFHDLQAQSRSFEAMAYFAGGESSVSIAGRAEYAAAYVASPGFFQVVGARAALGRVLAADDHAPGAPLAIVISDAFWRAKLGGDPAVLGTTLGHSGRRFTIVGVLSPGLQYPPRADLYYPSWIVPETTSRSAHNYRVLARLADGETVAAARAEVTAIAARLERLYPESNAGKGAAVVPLQELVASGTRQTLLVLFGAVGLVLLIACANVANLMLVRVNGRSREMAVRAAMGASRRRLVRQLLTESLLLAVVAGLAGASLAQLGVSAFVALAPADLPRMDEVRVDGSALLFSLAVALAGSALFGVAPAVRAARVHLRDAIRDGGKGTVAAGVRSRPRAVLVGAEIALAVLLAAGAGLLARSLEALQAVDLGFDPDHVVVLRTAVPVPTQAEAPRAAAFYRQLLTDIRGIPGVQSIAGVTSLPTAVRSNGSYWIEGGPGPADSGVRAPQAVLTVVTPDYFRTMRIPLRSGRDFADHDGPDAPLVAIVNEALVRTSFPDRDPIGLTIRCGLDTLEPMRIVGVVGDVRTWGPAVPPEPELYMPYEQHPGPATSLNLVARAGTMDRGALVQTVERRVRLLNPDVPVKSGTMEEALHVASAAPRFRTWLFAAFAAVALLLAGAGVYGVVAYAVTQRLPELAVRVALGAAPRDIVRMILGDGIRIAGAGLAAGMALALTMGELLEGLLFGVGSRDPLTLLGVAGAVGAAALAASYVPARRAMRVDPVAVLRGE